MNKSELIDLVAANADVSAKDTAAVLNAFEDVVTATVKAGKEPVAWTGFLKFERANRKAGTARNPQTGETIKTKAKKYPKVTAGAAFKKVVNGESPAPKLKKK